MLEWCEKLENHLSNYKWKTNEAIKRMLLSCITGSARQVIVLLQHTGAGLAFVNYETGDFFSELLKKFSQEKDEPGDREEIMILGNTILTS